MLREDEEGARRNSLILFVFVCFFHVCPVPCFSNSFLRPQRAFWHAVAIRWLNQAEHHGFSAACHDATAPKPWSLPSSSIVFFCWNFELICRWNPLQVFSSRAWLECQEKRECLKIEMPVRFLWASLEREGMNLRHKTGWNTHENMTVNGCRMNRMNSFKQFNSEHNEPRRRSRRSFWAFCVNSSGPPWNRMAPRRLGLRTEAASDLSFLAFLACRTVARFEPMFYWHCWLCMDFRDFRPILKKDGRIVGICRSLPFLQPDFKLGQFVVASWVYHMR